MREESKMTFIEHLEELRRRLIISVLSVLAGMVICWFFRDAILSFLLAPLYEAWRQVDGLDEPHPLNFTSMLEPFVAYLKLSAIGGFFLSVPVVLYQLWKFIAPGLYAKERRMVIPFVLVSSLLFVGGSTMAYSMVFPIGFRFFLEFAAGQEMTEAAASIDIQNSFPDPETRSEKSPGKSPEKAPTPPRLPPVDFADAGPDASVEAADLLPAAGPPRVEASPPPVQKTEDKPHWFVAVLKQIFTDDCGALTISRTVDGAGAALSIAWHRARCGPLPDQIRVRRDGEIIKVKWQSVSSDGIDLERFVATDFPTAGVHSYVLKAPKNPSAHRLAPVLMVKDYLSFAIRLLLAFGLVFELPILISFLAIAGIVNYRHLLRFFRYFVVIAFVIGAILTPPDVITQLILATPLIILYGLSIVVAYLLGEKPED